MRIWFFISVFFFKFLFCIAVREADGMGRVCRPAMGGAHGHAAKRRKGADPESK